MQGDEHCVKSLEDANAFFMSSKRLRNYFAMLVYHCRPSDPQKLFDEHLDMLYPPISAKSIRHNPPTLEQRREETLRELEYHFRNLDSSCE